MIGRLGACAFGLVCVLAILFLVALRGQAVDLNSDWLLEDLTCKELVEAYGFEHVVLNDIVATYYECIEFSNSPADAGYGKLHCALLRKNGEYVKGLINDIANVHNAKPECSPPK